MSTANEELKLKADDLKGKLDTVLQMLQGSSDRGPESDERAEESRAESRPEKQPDTLQTVERSNSSDAAIRADVAYINQRDKDEAATAEHTAPELQNRLWLTVKNASAVGFRFIHRRDLYPRSSRGGGGPRSHRRGHRGDGLHDHGEYP